MLDELAASGFPPRESDRVGRVSPTGRRRLRRPAAEGRAPPDPRVRRRGGVPDRSRRWDLARAASSVAVRRHPASRAVEPAARTDAQSQRPLRRRGYSPTAPLAPSGERPPGLDGAGQHESGPALPRRHRLAAAGRAARSPGTSTSSSRLRLTTSATPPTACSTWSGCHHGFVVSSQVSGGDPGVQGSGARPRQASTCGSRPESSRRSMGDLSDLGHVVSRTDGTHDITKRFVSARKRIDALTASRDRLLRQLGDGRHDHRADRASGLAFGSSRRASQPPIKDLAKAQQRVQPGAGRRRDHRRRPREPRAERGRSATPSTTPDGCSPSPRAWPWSAGPHCCPSRC